MRERSNIIEKDRNEDNGQGNRYLTPLNNLCEGIHEQDMSRSPLPFRQRGSEDREINTRDQEVDEESIPRDRRDSIQIPRTIGTPSVILRRNKPLVVSEFAPDPERKAFT